MPRVQARAAIRTLAIAAASSLAAGLMTTLAPATAASAGQVRRGPGFITKLLNNARPARTTPDASAGSISGLVTGDGRPLPGICAVAYSPGNGVDSFVTTSKAGRYRITGLPRGRYWVTFDADARQCPNHGNWLIQWYRQLDALYPPPKAVRVPVWAGNDTPGINAKLKHGGRITGVVHNESGRALGGICVEASSFFQMVSARTDAHGHYSISGLFPDLYGVAFFIGCGNKGNYAPQLWPGTRHAKTVEISGHRTVAGIDAVLRPGALVTGTVDTSDAGHRPLAGICLGASSDSGTFGGAEATTAKDGQFTLKGLAAGRYDVQVDPTCSGKKANLYQGANRSLKVKTGRVLRNFRIFLRPGAGVSGRVTNSRGRPIKGVCVNINGADGQSKTDAAGRYQILGFDPGKSSVEFSGGCGNSVSVVGQYYKNVPDPLSATLINFQRGQIVPDISAVMQPGATVAGKVTNRTGRPLIDTCVRMLAAQDAASDDPDAARFAFTDSAGRYRFRNLTPGPYHLVAGCGSDAPSWFRSALDSTTASFLATLPSVTTTVDFKLSRAGSISGTVTDSAGHPVEDVCVQVASPKTKLLLDTGPGPEITGGRGRYHLNSLASGQYILLFSDCRNRPQLGTQWYNRRTTASLATPVTVRAGQRTTGIDAALRPGATISGTISGPGGKPVLVCVSASDPAGLAFADVRSNAQGRYSVTGLGTGSYTLYLAPCGNKDPDLGAITVPGKVTVTAPHAAIVNVSLAPGGSISGTVLGGSHGTIPQTDACVVAVPSDPDGSQPITNADLKGRYLLQDLAPGVYKIYFGASYCSDFADPEASMQDAPQWYSNQPTTSTATTVTVTAGHPTNGIDAKLGPFGSIVGSVFSTGLAGLGQECVTAVPVDAPPNPLLGGQAIPETAISTPSGRYALLGLLPGRYKVKFSSGCGRTGYASQWWNDASSQKSAKVINVGFTEVGGIDARLQRR